jgi:hypothetical protein
MKIQGYVKVTQNARFSGRHGDLPLRKLVGAPALTSVVARIYCLKSVPGVPFCCPIFRTISIFRVGKEFA